MIYKIYEIEKNLKKNKNYLFFGQNEGLKEELILKLLKNFKPEDIFRYSEKDILNNLDEFYSNILSKSFFENEKLIIINNISDKFIKIIEDILEKKIDDITIVLTTGILEKRSKIRQLFEKDKKLLSVPFYNDEKITLMNIANTFFKLKKINISQETINLLVDRSSEDRKNLKNELSKIEIFLGDKKKLANDDLLRLTNLSENHSINKIVDLSLAKEKRQVLKILNENNFNSEDAIVFIRSFLIKSKRLLKLSDQVQTNKNIDQIISFYKPPIFWKEKDIVKKQLKIWKKDTLISLILEANNIELKLKKYSFSTKEILYNFIFEKCA